MNNLHKFLSFNNKDADSDPDSDPYESDHFRMYEFKIRRCTRSRSHDWTDCPFAHPSEKARRRDPRLFHYSGTVCSEYRRGGGCSRGDDCEFAHGVFECWLHPSRYRTEACKDGKNCRRKVCFFAHSPRQLRMLPEISSSPKYTHQALSSQWSVNHKNHRCMYSHSVNSSPTSTLLSVSHLSRSPSLSPPLSPVKHGFLSISQYSDRLGKLRNSEMSVGYKEALNQLMSSLDTMNFNEVSSPMSVPCSNSSSMNLSSPWIDVNSFNVEDQQQFVLSPSTPNPFGADQFSNKYYANNRISDNISGLASTPDPDLGWVNDLLM